MLGVSLVISHSGTVPVLAPPQPISFKASGALRSGVPTGVTISLVTQSSISFQVEVTEAAHCFALTLRVAVTPLVVRVVVPKLGFQSTVTLFPVLYILSGL